MDEKFSKLIKKENVIRSHILAVERVQIISIFNSIFFLMF